MMSIETKDEGTTRGGDDKSKDKSPVENPPSPEGSEGEAKTISYETYRKLLSEKKNLQSENEKLKGESTERERRELESKEEYKKLYESSKTENEELKNKVKSHEERWQDALKLNAFNSALGDTKKIEPKYYGFIDTSKILIDPETNKVDAVSVQKEVDRVTRDYPELIKSTIKGNMPNNAPSSGGFLTLEQWKNLPLKEQKARMKEVKD